MVPPAVHTGEKGEGGRKVSGVDSDPTARRRAAIVDNDGQGGHHILQSTDDQLAAVLLEYPTKVKKNSATTYLFMSDVAW